MICVPDTVTRIANSEAERIRPDVREDVTSVLLVPTLGEQAEAFVDDDGFLAFPKMRAPDFVELRWLGDGEVCRTYAEVVSSHYFRMQALLDYGDGRDDFGDLPDEALFVARQAATEVFEQAAHRSFVHRLGRTKDYGRDRLLQLGHNDVYELLTDGYQLVSDNQAVPCGCDMQYPAWVAYKYGCDVMPAQVSRAVLELAAYMLRPTNRPTGATGESTDAGYIHFTTAGRDGATDIPEVNAAIAQFGRGVQMVW